MRFANRTFRPEIFVTSADIYRLSSYWLLIPVITLLSIGNMMSSIISMSIFCAEKGQVSCNNIGVLFVHLFQDRQTYFLNIYASETKNRYHSKLCFGIHRLVSLLDCPKICWKLYNQLLPQTLQNWEYHCLILPSDE